MSCASVAIAQIESETDGSENVWEVVIEPCRKKCVSIYGGASGRNEGYASGVLVSDRGLVVTTNGSHLAAEEIRVVLADGGAYVARVVRRSPTLHVALLQIEARDLSYFKLERSYQGRSGDWLLSISNAFDAGQGAEPLAVTMGVLSRRAPLRLKRGTQDFEYNADALQYDMITANPGAEGGAIVNAEGELVGVIGRMIEDRDTGFRINYAVPVDLVAAFVAGEESRSNPPPSVVQTHSLASLGIRLFSLGGKNAPPFVDRVIPRSRAATAGIKSDDLVVAISGKKVQTIEEAELAVKSIVRNAGVLIEVKRGDTIRAYQLEPLNE